MGGTPWWKHPILRSAGIVLVGGGLFTVFDWFDRLPDALANVAAFLLAPNALELVAPAVTPLGRVLVCAIYALAIVGLAAAAYVVQRRVERARAENARLFFAPLQALYRLLIQMGLERDISDFEREVTIRSNLDVEVRDRLSIAATNRVLPAIEVNYGSDVGEYFLLERAELSVRALGGEIER